MIVTLTANPSLDRTVEITEALHRGAVMRASRSVADPGGKGVNIARALQVSGVQSVAVLPGDDGDPVLAALAEAGVRYSNLSSGAPIRTNVTIAEPDGTTTKINAPGERLDGLAQQELTRLLIREARGASWLVLAGSLPPGVPSDYYAVVARAVREGLGSDSPRVAVDSSGAALRDTVTGQDGLPDLIKPNSEELAELVGRPGTWQDLEGDIELTARTARELVARGIESVLSTLGSKGAVLTTREGSWHAVHDPVRVRSTVGAGDCSLAGFLLAHQAGKSPADCLRQAVAHGSAAASLPGTQVPAQSQTTPDRVTVRGLGLA